METMSHGVITYTTSRMVRARQVQVKKSDGSIGHEFIVGDSVVHEEKPYYKYDCDWENLKALMQTVKDNTDGTGQAMAVMTSIPRIKVNIDECDDRDPAGHGQSMIMKSIISDSRLTGAIGCTVGDIKRMENERMTHISIYHYVDEEWPWKRRQTEMKSYKMVSEQMTKSKFSSTCTLIKSEKDLVEMCENQFLYAGYHSHLLHEKKIKGMTYEFNYPAAASLGVTIVDQVDIGDKVKVTYLRNGETWTVNYYKKCELYSLNGGTYLNRGSVGDTAINGNIYNVISSEPFLFNTRYKHVNTLGSIHVLDRAVVPAINNNKTIEFEKHKYVVGCHDDDPVWIMSPAYEIRCNKWLMEKIFSVKYQPCKEGDFTTISSAMNVFHTFTSNNVGENFIIQEYDFPSQFFHCNGKWELRAYPYHKEINGVKVSVKGDIVTPIPMYDKLGAFPIYIDDSEHDVFTLPINYNSLNKYYIDIGDGMTPLILLNRDKRRRLYTAKIGKIGLINSVVYSFNKVYDENLIIPLQRGEYWKTIKDKTLRYVRGNGDKYMEGSIFKMEKKRTRYVTLKHVAPIIGEYKPIYLENTAIAVHKSGSGRVYEFATEYDAERFANVHKHNIVDSVLKKVDMFLPCDGTTVLWPAIVGDRVESYRNELHHNYNIKTFNPVEARLVMMSDRDGVYDGGTVSVGESVRERFDL